MDTYPTKADRPINIWLSVVLPISLMAAMLIIDTSPLDFAVADLFYVRGEGFIGRHNRFLEDILHDGIKQAVIAVFIFSLLGLLLTMVMPGMKKFRRSLTYLVLALGLSTAFVTPLKLMTGMHCPWSLTQYGGSEIYTPLLSHRAPTSNPGHCWPGGHASAGFAFFAFYFLWRNSRPRLARLAFIFALTLGTVLSIGRMLQGAHFLSHNLWTGLLSWLICLSLYSLMLHKNCGIRVNPRWQCNPAGFPDSFLLRTRSAYGLNSKRIP